MASTRWFPGMQVHLASLRDGSTCYSLRRSGLSKVAHLAHAHTVGRDYTAKLEDSGTSTESPGRRAGASRSVTSVSSASFSARVWVKASLRSRHDQLPPGLLGIFMRQS